MKQDEINKDLDSYIHVRRDKPFWKKYSAPNIKPKYNEEEMDSAIRHEIEHVKEEEHHMLKPEDKQELESMEKHVEEVNEEEKEAVEEIDEKEKEAVEEIGEERREAIDKADVEREGVLKKFFKKLNFSDEKDNESQVVQMSDNPEITMDDTELRELLHGLHNWIIQLPADKLEQFKNSKEFELYTKYLRKHNLIK
jgi:small-conductance mechanosensitive channel